MEKKYTLGEVNILIKTDFDFTDVERYIPFVSDFEKPDITYEFITVDELPELPEEPIFYDGMVRIFRKDNVTYRCYAYSADDSKAVMSDERINEGVFTVYVLRAALDGYRTEMRVFDHLAIEHIMALFHGTMLHSSFISYEGKAILFTAPSQTGKSTQAELWRKHRNASVINGDRSLIKLKDDTLYAYSLPYCGTSNICENYNAPIQAIVVLRQAPYNRITQLRPTVAFRNIYEGCATNIWYSDDVNVVCDLIEQMVKRVPIYLLECLPNEDAVNTLASELGL